MRITIVGTGYVGLTAGVCLAFGGHRVACVDIGPERVAAINRGEALFYEPGLPEMLSTTLANKRLHATSNLEEAVVGSDVTFITVGTPEISRAIDLSCVVAAAQRVGLALRQAPGYHVVSLKSSVVPGTTAIVRSLLEEGSRRRVGEFGLCTNPEFLREGSAIHDFMNPDRIVIGQWDEKSGKMLAKVYQSFDCPKIFTTPANAEMIKYASNALLATLISFSNEMATLCEVTPSVDVKVVLQGVHLDRRLSPVVNGQRISPGILSYLWAGCGFGGSCLPKDVNALRAYARERSAVPRLLDAVLAVNAERPAYLKRLAEQALGSLRGATVAVLGLAFKPGTDDLRESPAVAVIKLLRSKGADVKAYDPIVTSTRAGSRLDALAKVCTTPEEALRNADAAMVVTACPEFAVLDWPVLCGQMRRPVIIDGRNALEAVSWPKGVRYFSIGRMPDETSG